MSELIGGTPKTDALPVDRSSEYRRVLVSIASIEIDWRMEMVTAQEAMKQISDALRKATEK